MTKRSHKNTPRLTARERATRAATDFMARLCAGNAGGDELVVVIQRALVAHARQALRRDDRRDRK